MLRVLPSLLLCSALAACGQSGQLYLPDQTPKTQPPPAPTPPSPDDESEPKPRSGNPDTVPNTAPNPTP
jgi:predicted small lipoprotein YifL